MLNIKKSATRRFFLLCLFYLLSCYSNTTLATKLDCTSEYFDESAIVKHVHDGDTVKLLDGRKIRLIGINAPEMAKNSKAAEAFAIPARELLRTLLSKNQNRIKLIHGQENLDHYQRTLAHLFLHDGTNLQAELLSAGLVNAITIPPNSRFANCYQKKEKQALCEKKGLWSRQIPHIVELENSTSGFHILKGTVLNVATTNKGSWLTLDHGLMLRISSLHQALFNHQRLQSLLGQTVIVRGWLQAKRNPKKGERFYMKLKHPSSIEAENKALKC